MPPEAVSSKYKNFFGYDEYNISFVLIHNIVYVILLTPRQAVHRARVSKLVPCHKVPTYTTHDIVDSCGYYLRILSRLNPHIHQDKTVDSLDKVIDFLDKNIDYLHSRAP